MSEHIKYSCNNSKITIGLINRTLASDAEESVSV